MQKPLNILITRPLAQVQYLKEAIQAMGNHALLFPTLAIKPITLDIFSLILQLDKTDIIIFTSTNAILYSIPFLKKESYNFHQIILAIGQATQQMLHQYAFPTVFTPSIEFNSEGLLACDILKNVYNKSIVIFKGKGGRDMLKSSLEQRGAFVQEIICYERTRPFYTHMSKRLKKWHSMGLDLIISTSQESLNNLFHLVPKNYQNWLQSTPFLVLSHRLKNIALQTWKIQNIIVAQMACDEGILDTLIEWRKNK